MAISKDDILEAVRRNVRNGPERPGQGIRRKVRRVRSCNGSCWPAAAAAAAAAAEEQTEFTWF